MRIISQSQLAHFFKKKAVRYTLLSLLVFGLFFLIGFIKKYHIPKLKTWALLEIENYTTQNTPIRVWPKDIEMSFFPLGLEVKDVDLLPQNELAKKLSPGHIESIQAYLSWFSLIQGQLKLSELVLHKPEISYIDKLKKPKKVSPTQISKLSILKAKDLFFNKLISEIPIESLVIENLNAYISLNQIGYAFHTEDLNLNIDLERNKIVSKIQSPKIQIKQLSKENYFQVYLSSTFVIHPEQFDYSNLELIHHDSEIKGSGYLRWDANMESVNDIQSNMSIKLKLPDIRKKVLSFFPQISIPNLKGDFTTDFSFQKFKDKTPTSQFHVTTQNLSINQFVVGDLDTKGRLLNEKIDLLKLDLSNNSGQISLENTSFDLLKNYKFQTQIYVKSIELRQLLINLGVPSTPLHLDVSGLLPCSGGIKPKFELKCNNGHLNVSNFNVHSGAPDKYPIAGFTKMDIKGDVTVDSDKVLYQAQLEMPQSKGTSSGVIDYGKGFDIQYESPDLQLSDLTTLANLKFEGSVKVKGRTFGDSHKGRIQMNVGTKDFWFEDYLLNQLQTQVDYNSGILKFNNILGKYKTSQYSGRTSINLKNNQIFVKIQSPFLDAEDLSSVIERRFKLPFFFSGTGTAYAKVWGPMNLSQLSYNVKTNLFRGTIAKESYDELQLEIDAIAGQVKSKNSYLKKGQGQFKLLGSVDPKGQMNSQITGYNLKLEEFEMLTQMNLNLTGNFNFNTQLKGYILDPEIESEGKFVNISMNNEPLPPSHFELGISKKSIKAKAQFMNNTVVTHFNFPLTNEENFQLYLKTKKWNFTRFLSLFADQAERKKYHSELDSVIDIKSSKGGFWSSNGQVLVTSFLVRNPPYLLKNKETMTINVKNGVINTDKFYVEGENSKLELIAQNLTQNKLSATLSGHFPLTLATILTPLSELKGDAETHVQLSGTAQDPQLDGNFSIKNGLIKIKEFPDYFDNIFSQIRFNMDYLDVISTQGKLGQGPFSAQGRIEFKGIRDLPMNFQGKFNEVRLTVPEGVSSRGFGDFKIHGRWFPYTLSANYTILDGSVTKEFNDSKSSNTLIKPSQFLPQFLTQESISPIELDLLVKITNPIPVKNSRVDAKVLGELTVKGNPLTPVLNGNLNALNDGKIFFRNNEFEILNANLTYKNDPPENPNIVLASRTQIQTEDLTYDVQLNVLGTASNPNFKLTSIPPLKEYEIISLLALGMTQQELDKKVDAEELAAQTSYQLGSALLASPLGKQIKNRFGFEFNISSEFDEEDTVVPKVTIKKQLTKKLDATASRTLDQNPKNNVKLKYKVNKNLSVIGVWDGTENKDTTGVQSDASTSIFGVDLEFKRKFK